MPAKSNRLSLIRPIPVPGNKFYTINVYKNYIFRQREKEIQEDNDNKSDRATMATEDDHHGSDKDFKEANSNLRQKREYRSVATTAQERYQQKTKQERKQRKKAWADEPERYVLFLSSYNVTIISRSMQFLHYSTTGFAAVQHNQ